MRWEKFSRLPSLRLILTILLLTASVLAACSSQGGAVATPIATLEMVQDPDPTPAVVTPTPDPDAMTPTMEESTEPVTVTPPSAGETN
jgi:hypothetical protein